MTADSIEQVARCVWCRRLCVTVGERGQCPASPICEQRPLGARDDGGAPLFPRVPFATPTLCPTCAAPVVTVRAEEAAPATSFADGLDRPVLPRVAEPCGHVMPDGWWRS